jgi:hypothetical protein
MNSLGAMKHRVMIPLCLAAFAATASPFGLRGNDTPQQDLNRKADVAGATGVLSPAQTQALKRVAGQGLAHSGATMDAQNAESSSLQAPGQNQPAMQGGAQMQPMAGMHGHPSSQMMGQPGPGPGQAGPPPAPPKPAEPQWRLEGVIFGGHHKPMALFAVAGLGEIVVRPGQHVNAVTLVTKIEGQYVSLKADGKTQSITPW